MEALQRHYENQRRASKRYYDRNSDTIKMKRRIRYMIQKATRFICQECGNRYENHEELFVCFDCEMAELLYAEAPAPILPA